MSSFWNSDKSLILSRILTKAVIALALSALVWIPIVTGWYDTVSAKEPIQLILNICFYFCDVLGITAVVLLDRLLKNIADKKLFIEENVTYIRVISWCCFGVAAAFLALSAWRLLALLVAFIAAFCGLIIRVVKNFAAAAVEIKEENDYTI